MTRMSLPPRIWLLAFACIGAVTAVAAVTVLQEPAEVEPVKVWPYEPPKGALLRVELIDNHEGGVTVTGYGRRDQQLFPDESASPPVAELAPPDAPGFPPGVPPLTAPTLAALDLESIERQIARFRDAGSGLDEVIVVQGGGENIRSFSRETMLADVLADWADDSLLFTFDAAAERPSLAALSPGAEDGSDLAHHAPRVTELSDSGAFLVTTPHQYILTTRRDFGRVSAESALFGAERTRRFWTERAGDYESETEGDGPVTPSNTDVRRLPASSTFVVLRTGTLDHFAYLAGDTVVAIGSEDAVEFFHAHADKDIRKRRVELKCAPRDVLKLPWKPREGEFDPGFLVLGSNRIVLVHPFRDSNNFVELAKPAPPFEYQNFVRADGGSESKQRILLGRIHIRSTPTRSAIRGSALAAVDELRLKNEHFDSLRLGAPFATETWHGRSPEIILDGTEDVIAFTRDYCARYTFR